MFNLSYYIYCLIIIVCFYQKTFAIDNEINNEFCKPLTFVSPLNHKENVLIFSANYYSQNLDIYYNSKINIDVVKNTFIEMLKKNSASRQTETFYYKDSLKNISEYFDIIINNINFIKENKYLSQKKVIQTYKLARNIDDAAERFLKEMRPNNVVLPWKVNGWFFWHFSGNI